MISREDRYLGCLIGLACGDALGGPVEFDTRAQMDERFPDGLREFIGGGWLELFPGKSQTIRRWRWMSPVRWPRFRT
ncbi:MAG: ADP-ribosylglycohydrolase family protein [Thermomicrobiales bacterium]